MNILDFKAFKQQGHKISMLTCYDFWSARILNASQVDCLLVGDSLGMVMHGFETTLPVTVEMMALHTQAVCKGAPDKWIVGDMPFLSFRKSLSDNMLAAEKIMQAGAHSLKLEGVEGNEDLISHLVYSGVPVMGHIGLTPQSIYQLGGFKVQGRGLDAADRLLEQAKRLEGAGCFSLVLECVPSPVAQKVTSELSIPTIGIGAGPDTDGQVLVLQDMLGLNMGFKPKFLRTFFDGQGELLKAVNQFDQAVKGQDFPRLEESYE